VLEPSTRYVSMYTIRYLTFVHGMILESELRIMRLSGYGHKKVASWSQTQLRMHATSVHFG